MYYTKNRGFENQWFLKEGFEVEIFIFSHRGHRERRGRGESFRQD